MRISDWSSDVCSSDLFNVNKNDLVAVVADKTGLSKADATKSVDCVFDAITDSLKTGDEVRLVGFGTFTVSQRAASEGRNPRTGERIQIPASKQPTFKAGKGLKAAVHSTQRVILPFRAGSPGDPVAGGGYLVWLLRGG